jgi:hypothetical protein
MCRVSQSVDSICEGAVALFGRSYSSEGLESRGVNRKAFYKVLKLTPRSKRIATPMQNQKAHMGWNNAKHKSRGLHVFTTREAAKNSSYMRNIHNTFIVKVKCDREDLMGYNANSHTAMFRHVYISQREMQNALFSLVRTKRTLHMQLKTLDTALGICNLQL